MTRYLPSGHRRAAVPLLAAAGALTGAVALAGCASSGDVSHLGQGGPSPSSSRVGLPGAPGGGKGGRPAPPTGVTHGPLRTVTGVIERGAEPSCLVLRDATGVYDLQGPVAARLRPERKVSLRGHVVRGVASHCMDGTPFAVTAVVHH